LAVAKNGIDGGLSVSPSDGLALGRQAFAALFGTDDRTIGMQSFIDNVPAKPRSSATEALSALGAASQGEVIGPNLRFAALRFYQFLSTALPNLLS
jgi:hypothetical protein